MADLQFDPTLVGGAHQFDPSLVGDAHQFDPSLVGKAPEPQSSGSTAEDLVRNYRGGLLGTVAGAGAALSSAVGANEVASVLDQQRQEYEQDQKENGGGTLGGKAASLVGAVTPALLLPASKVAQVVGNAGLFAIPAFRDTLKAKLDQGQSFPLALAHASEAFGINLFLPTVATRGSGAVLNALGQAESTGARGVATALGQAAAEGTGFSAASSALDKGTDLVAGQKNDNDWVNLKDMAASALGFTVLRGAHMAPQAASAIGERVGTKSQQFGNALAQDIDNRAPGLPADEVAGYMQGETLNPNLANPQPKAQPADILAAPSVDEAIRAANEVVSAAPSPLAKASEAPTIEQLLAEVKAKTSGLDQDLLSARPLETPDVSDRVAPDAAVSASAGGRSVDDAGSVGPGELLDRSAGGAVDAPAAPVEGRGEDAVLGVPGSEPNAVEPSSTWFGRAGDGYKTQGDATMALPSRLRIAPDLNWAVEQMPNGKFRLAGYQDAPERPASAPDVQAEGNVAPEAAQPLAPDVHDRPLAAEGLDSYRYRGPYGWVMIGAKDHADALNEAARSLESQQPPTMDRLQVFDKTANQYVPAESAAETINLGATGGPGPAGGKNARSRSYDANPFKAFIAKHGLPLDERSEFAPGVTEQRKAMVPGYGPIFRRSGKPIDTLVQDAIEEGFLPRNEENGDTRLREMITQALSGRRIIAQHAEGVVEAEAQAELKRREDMANEAASTLEEVHDAGLFHLADDEDIPWDTPEKSVDTATFLSAMGASEQEIADEVANESRRAQEADRSGGETQEAARGQAQGTGAGRDEQARAGEELSRPSREDVLAQQERAQAGERDVANADRVAAQRSQADAQRADFKLSGSDRAADANSDQDRLFTKGEPFYSALSHEVGNINAKAQGADGWLSQVQGLIKSGKVKADEVEWTGLNDWLKLQSGKVTKEQVTEFLKNNGVQVKDVEKLPIPNSPDGTKYGQYTLPGGENYREVLLTLPPTGMSREAAFEKAREVSREAGNATDPAEQRRLMAEYDRLTGEGQSNTGYRSSHFDEPNILAHIRLNDRTDADGKKVLFVEEIQSDWAQQGKKEGFKTTDKRVATNAERKDGYWEVTDADGKFVTNVMDFTMPDAKAEDAIRIGNARLEHEKATEVATDRRPPPAPFVGKTDAWVSLAIKRIVKMAVDEGYDKVAFVNGEQSADRYDLSKQISRVEFQDNHTLGVGLADLEGPTTRGIIHAYDHDGLRVIAQSIQDAAKELPDLIGKDAAEKLLNAPAKSQRTEGGNHSRVRTLSGIDLKVGGEGMKAFYDKIVPSVAKDVIRKLGGEGMTSAKMLTNPADGGGTPMRGAEYSTQPAFDITPAMREKAAGGVPLFTEAQPARPLAAFRELKGAGGISEVAKVDAERMLGVKSPVPVLRKSDPELARKGVPMYYDVGSRTIVYNTAYKGRSRAEDAQWMTEEILHAVDHADGLISLSSDKFKPGGEVWEEVQAARERSGILKNGLQYPLDMAELSQDRKSVELFARLGVIYKGFADILKAAAPKTYEVYRAIFTPDVPGSIRADARMGGQDDHAPVDVAGGGQDAGQGGAGQGVDQGLASLRRRIAEAVQGTEQGRVGDFNRLETRAEPADEREHPYEGNGAVDLHAGLNPKQAIKALGSGYSAYGGVEQVPRESRGTVADSIAKALVPAGRKDAELTAGIVRANLGEQARGREVAQQHLIEFAKRFDKMPVADNYKFIDGVERGIPQKGAEMESAALAARKVLDERRDQVIALGKGALENFNENYFPHIWKDPAAASNFFTRRPLEGGKGFLKQRTYDFFSDGIKAGLEPVTTNPMELVMLKAREMDRYIYGQRIFKEMKDAGIAKFVAFGGKAPDGWVKINDKIARVMQYSEAEKGMILRGEYYAPEQAATLINNHLSPGLAGVAAFDMIRRAGNMMNAAQLGLSAFHLGFTTLDAMISKAALGIKQTSRGDVLKGAGSIAQSLNPLQPLINLYKGDKLFRAYMGNLNDPQMAPLVEALTQAGGRVKMDDVYRNAAINEFRQAIRKGNYGTAALKAIPRAMDLINKPIFEYLVPRQKLGVFFDMAKDAMESKPNMSLDEKRAVMGKLWDSVDNRMGELVYDNVFWNRALKDSLMVSVRSVGWNLGTFREIGGGVKDLKDIGKLGGLSDRSAYVFALPFITAIIGSMTQYLMTGEGPKELKDVFFPRTGKDRPDGTQDRLSLPSYMKDIYEYGHDFRNFAKYGEDPFHTIENKMHPLISTLGQVFTNKDFFGGAIRSPGDSTAQQAVDEASYMLKQITPFSLRNYQQQAKLKGEEPSIGGYLSSPSMIGITPAPGYITKNDEEAQSAQVSKMRDALVTKFREEVRDGADWRDIDGRAKDAGLGERDREYIKKAATQRPAKRLKEFATH